MTITTRLFTLLHGSLIGTDAAGNHYYEERRGRKSRKRKRWVLYNGKADPSKVPAEWHGWLHYTMNTPPSRQHRSHYAWEKPHLPNLTGTPGAYLPPGHLQKGGMHAPTVADYEAWKP